MKKIHDFDEVFDSQKMFRLILEAMANPTRIVSIKQFLSKLYGNTPEFLGIALTLLDNEVSFNTCGDDELGEDIVSLTLARNEKLENADFIFVPNAEILENVIEKAKCGTLKDPHKSATLIVKNTDSRNPCLRLYGAGINGTTAFQTSDTVQAALNLRDKQYYEYPQGIDFIFVSQNGDLFSIPRLVWKEAL